MPAANRRAVREAVVQTAFECEFRGCADEQEQAFARNIAELDVNYEPDFASSLLAATFEHMDELKAWVEQLAPEWPWSKIAQVDRAVLLAGLAELKYLEKFDIPPKATLNEYVEIAKNYGDDSSRRFVNGVLSSANKELEN
ncbi:MAG: transcription antitermination factor NusB [Patescibacteria group bacterium]